MYKLTPFIHTRSRLIGLGMFLKGIATKDPNSFVLLFANLRYQGMLSR